MKEEIKCKICGKTFKSKAGLAGHMKIEHGIMKRITYPDEVAKRLKAVESQMKNFSGSVIPLISESFRGVQKTIEKTIETFEEISELTKDLTKRIFVLERSGIKPEKQSDKAIPKEQEHLKEPGLNQKKIILSDQAKERTKLLEDLLKEQLDRRDMLLKYDENGKPVVARKPQQRGIF